MKSIDRLFLRRRFVIPGLLLVLSAINPLPGVPATGLAFAEPTRSNEQSATLTETERHATIQALERELNQRYIFPDVAIKIGEDLQKRERQGEYARIDSGDRFAEMLTEHIRGVSHDMHLKVEYSRDPVSAERKDGKPGVEEQAEMEVFAKYFNLGVQKVERLPGNIGYVDLRAFPPPDLAGTAFAAAMTLLSNTDALIIDLRKNGGGEPSMVALAASYFFDERTHLNDLVWRENNATEQYWTTEHVAGKKYGQKKAVYVLTGKRTFSGGEEFANDMKTQKRATLVGETTGGGAHPGDAFRVNAHFMAFIATGRAVNPITHTDWEGVGVEPDVKVTADDALRTAQILALKKLIVDSRIPPQKQDREKRLAELEKSATAPTAPATSVH